MFNNPFRKFKKQISIYTVTPILCVYFAYVLNIPLITAFFKSISQDSSFELYFVICSISFAFLAFFLIFNLINFKYIFKPIMTIFLALGATVFYAEQFLGITFNYGVVISVFETNSSEALSYLNLPSTISFCIFGLIPIILLWKTNISYPNFKKSTIIRLGSIAVTVCLMLGIFASNTKTIFPFFRNHNELGDYPNPIIYVANSVDIIVGKLRTPLPYQPIGDGAKEERKTDKPNLLVFVLGETARNQNIAYNGYDRDTNPYTKDLGLIPLQDVASCGTYTARSVPCMLSNIDRENFNSREIAARDNVLDIMSKAGLDVEWYNNNGYDCRLTGVCKDIKNIYISTNDCKNESAGGFCYDSILVKELKDNIQASMDENKSKVVVLHVVGSHGPTYFQRYPNEFKKFGPTCDKGDINSCSEDTLVNTYDNSIVYTDYILSQVIKELDNKDVQDKYDTAMVYISDHGESLGENGLYLHAAPYNLAPLYQKRVPWFMWFSNNFLQDNKLNKACLEKEAKQEETFSHDNVFDSFLGLMNIKSDAYSSKDDIFAKCRN